MSAVQNLMLKLQAVRNEPRPAFLVGRRANVDQRQKAIVRTVATTNLSLERAAEGAGQDHAPSELNRLVRVDAQGGVVRMHEASELSWASVSTIMMSDGIRANMLRESREAFMTSGLQRIAGLVEPSHVGHGPRFTAEPVVEDTAEEKFMKLRLSNSLIRSSLILHRQLAAAARMHVARYLATVNAAV